MISIAMILVNGRYLLGDIHHVATHFSGFPDDPMVPPETAYDEGRNIFIKPARERKVINGVRAPLDA
jgi:hypothetical protein